MGVATGPFGRKDLSSPSPRLTGMRGTVSRASAAALSVRRLAAAATVSRPDAPDAPAVPAAWATKGPATAPARVAAASPVRKRALTRPSTAPGISRCMVVCGITVRVIATALDLEAGELSGRLVAALAALGNALGRDLGEADWSRLLDALLLVAAHPADA